MSSESGSKNSLTIIIPTLNNVDGLNYLLNYFKNKQYEVIVVNNKKKNLGFAGGVNKGAKNVETKWMLILNDDIEFREKNDTIQKLIQFAEENNLDAVTPILRNPDGEVENFGYKVLTCGKVKLIKEDYSLDSRLRGNDSKESGDDTGEHPSHPSIDGLTAACLLVKTEVFKKLGGFDESFFAYLEDIDFFLRLKALDPRLRGDDKSSFGIAYDVEVLHNHMTTTKTMGNFKARQDMINWWRLFLKHPKKFKFNLDFIVERMRNVSGYIKASFK